MLSSIIMQLYVVHLTTLYPKLFPRTVYLSPAETLERWTLQFQTSALFADFIP